MCKIPHYLFRAPFLLKERAASCLGSLPAEVGVGVVWHPGDLQCHGDLHLLSIQHVFRTVCLYAQAPLEI